MPPACCGSASVSSSRSLISIMAILIPKPYFFMLTTPETICPTGPAQIFSGFVSEPQCSHLSLSGNAPKGPLFQQSRRFTDFGSPLSIKRVHHHYIATKEGTLKGRKKTLRKGYKSGHKITIDTPKPTNSKDHSCPLWQGRGVRVILPGLQPKTARQACQTLFWTWFVWVPSKGIPTQKH